MAFEIQADSDKNRITITLTGFATMDDVKRFEEERHRAHEQLPKYRGAHQLLYDVAGAMIQS